MSTERHLTEILPLPEARQPDDPFFYTTKLLTGQVEVQNALDAIRAVGDHPGNLVDQTAGEELDTREGFVKFRGRDHVVETLEPYCTLKFRAKDKPAPVRIVYCRMRTLLDGKPRDRRVLRWHTDLLQPLHTPFTQADGDAMRPEFFAMLAPMYGHFWKIWPEEAISFHVLARPSPTPYGNPATGEVFSRTSLLLLSHVDATDPYRDAPHILRGGPK